MKDVLVELEDGRVYRLGGEQAKEVRGMDVEEMWENMAMVQQWNILGNLRIANEYSRLRIDTARKLGWWR